ncbi:type I polyketide synthase [Rhodococcoides fascians]|uniref:type I polyketide synthase n=1 Tax=Rhodococcoides fascians TaxID=1828 RepID=UPI0036733F0C
MNDTLPDDAIAVVGMAGRFAAAEDVPEFWRAILDGRELITSYARGELLARGVPESVLDHPDYVTARGAISDPLGFDASFFGYSPREAQLMDPQQRLMLETAWHIAEDAGIRPDKMHGRVAVFAATAPTTYLKSFPPPAEGDPLEIQLGNDVDFAAARISYKLGLDGPSVGVSTACSSGLTAVHLACQSLMSGDSDTAFALAASIRFPADRGLIRVPGSILSADGHCRPFAADAEGTVEADGTAGVLLRRLDDALADGNRIYAAILGSAIGNDGNDRIGFSAPGVEGQRKIIEAALRYADVGPAQVGYVEAHGTGTRLGDPVETRALAAIYGVPGRTEPVRFGSVKSNTGHLNHVAGIAGLIKVVLGLKSGQIAPTLHLESGINPDLDLANGRLQPQTRLEPWPASFRRRIAAVSSFGMGGSGVHMIATAIPIAPSVIAPAGDPQVLLPLSARSPEALTTSVTALKDWLGRNPDADLRDVGYTLHEGRTPMLYRTAVRAGTTTEAIRALSTADTARAPVDIAGSTAVIFPGQGAEHPGSAARTYQEDAGFRRHLDACIDALPTGARSRVRSYLLDPSHPERGTELAQPALFAMEYARARCWETAGLEWTAMLGHSVGEFAAACLAGVLSMEDAMRMVAARGQLISTTGPGAMLAVQLPPDELRERLASNDGWNLAAYNAEDESVLSGDVNAIAAVNDKLRADGANTLPVEVTHAFHSHLLDPVLAEYGEMIAGVTLNAPSRPYISCVTGTWATAEQATSVDHWVRQARGTVLFAPSIRTALDAGTSVFVQLGPGLMTTSNLRRSRAQAIVIPGNEYAPQEGVGKAWTRGATIRCTANGKRIGLPGYPFEHREYSFAAAIEPSIGANTRVAPDASASSPATATSSARRYPRPPLATPYRPAADALEARIIGLVEKELSTEGIGVDDDFFDLGWDSLLVVGLASQLSIDLSIEVNPDAVYDASTAALLAIELEGLGADRGRGQ